MSQNLQLVVGGQNLTKWVEQDQWSIAQNWSRQGDTASFTLTDAREARTPLTYSIPPLASVTFTDVDLGVTLFSGVVPKPQMKTEGPLINHWQLDCVDWTYLADRPNRLVAGDYSNLTADQLVVAVTAQANCGINAALVADGGYVQPGPQIPRVQFAYMTLTEAWTRISKLSSIVGTYGWYVDENRNLHFYFQEDAASSGWTLTDVAGDQLLAGNTGYIESTYAYEWDATSIRNSVTVRGSDYNSSQTDLWVGDGNQSSWPLTFVPDASNVAQAVLTVAGVPFTVSAQTGTEASTDFVITGNAANQWFLQVNTAAVPASPDLISFTYPYLQPVLSNSTDTGSVGQFASLPNSGVFSYYIADSGLPTLLAAQKRGLRETATYALPTERVQVDLPEDFDGHIRAGTTVQVVNAVTPDSKNGYTAGLNGTYLVLQNRINGNPGLYRTYQLTGARIS